MDTHKRDADEKQIAEIGRKMITQVTKLINAKMNLSVQTVEKDKCEEATTLKLK